MTCVSGNRIAAVQTHASITRACLNALALPSFQLPAYHMCYHNPSPGSLAEPCLFVRCCYEPLRCSLPQQRATEWDICTAALMLRTACCSKPYTPCLHHRLQALSCKILQASQIYNACGNYCPPPRDINVKLMFATKIFTHEPPVMPGLAHRHGFGRAGRNGRFCLQPHIK